MNLSDYYFTKGTWPKDQEIILTISVEGIKDFILTFRQTKGKVNGKLVWTKKEVKRDVLNMMPNNLEALALLDKYDLL